MADYTGGTFSYTSHNTACFVTVDSLDLGLTLAGWSLNIAPVVNPRHYNEHKVATEAVRDTVSLEFTGKAAEVDFASGNLERIFGTVSADAGASQVFGVDNIGVSATYHVVIISFVDEKPAKRLKIWRAIIQPNGAIEGGPDTKDMVIPYKITCLADPDEATTENFFRFENSDDATDVTVTVSPAANDTGVAVDAAMTLTFSEEIGSFFRDNLFRYVEIIDEAGASLAATAVSWNAAGTVATLTHPNFTGTSLIAVAISSEIRATSGKYFAGNGTDARTRKVYKFETV